MNAWIMHSRDLYWWFRWFKSRSVPGVYIYTLPLFDISPPKAPLPE